MPFENPVFFDRYMATCRASLDKSGRAGVQKIHLMQPLLEHDTDVGALWERKEDSKSTSSSHCNSSGTSNGSSRSNRTNYSL